MKTCLLCECTSAGRLVTFRRRHICTDCEADLARRGLGWCTRGRHKAPIDELRHVPAWCRACASSARRARYASGAEAERARTRRYYAAHRERVQARMYAQRRAHPEARRAAQRRYYWRHRERIQDYRARTRETRQAVRRKWYARNPDYNRRWRAKKLIAILHGQR